jgi:hypothetical protein
MKAIALLACVLAVTAVAAAEEQPLSESVSTHTDACPLLPLPTLWLVLPSARLLTRSVLFARSLFVAMQSVGGHRY